MLTKALTFPVVHANGTHRDNLTLVLEETVNSLEKSLELLCSTAPNGRDFYPLGNRAIYDAENEHLGRIGRIESVIAELRAIWEHVDGQE